MPKSSVKRSGGRGSFPPGQVRIDCAEFLVNGGPVSLSPLPLPQLKEKVLPHSGARGSGHHGKVAWVHQGANMWCGRSSQAMLVNYWKPGTGADKKAFQDNDAHKLYGVKSVRELTGKPYVGLKTHDLDAVARSVEAGNPAIAYTKIYQRASDVRDHPGHIIVITGYDPEENKAEGGQFYANDPYAKNAETGTHVKEVGGQRLTKDNLEKLLYAQGTGNTAIYIPVPEKP